MMEKPLQNAILSIKQQAKFGKIVHKLQKLVLEGKGERLKSSFKSKVFA